MQRSEVRISIEPDQTPCDKIQNKIKNTIQNKIKNIIYIIFIYFQFLKVKIFNPVISNVQNINDLKLLSNKIKTTQRAKQEERLIEDIFLACLQININNIFGLKIFDHDQSDIQKRIIIDTINRNLVKTKKLKIIEIRIKKLHNLVIKDIKKINSYYNFRNIEQLSKYLDQTIGMILLTYATYSPYNKNEIFSIASTV